MFPEGTPDLQALLQQAAEMQERLTTAQQELADARVEGSAGGGLVHATVSGTGELVSLTIDPAACDPSDTETLADLIIAAVHNANDNAQRSAADAMGDVTAGLGGALGGGFSGFTTGDADSLEQPPDAR